jgi:hypothetical protein
MDLPFPVYFKIVFSSMRNAQAAKDALVTARRRFQFRTVAVSVQEVVEEPTIRTCFVNP